MNAGTNVDAAAWWLVRVQDYRFVIRREELDRVVHDLQPAAVAHLPAWVAGLIQSNGRLLGVIDLGRFLGVSTVMPGPLLLPAAGDASWALRVHAVEPAPPDLQAIEGGGLVGGGFAGGAAVSSEAPDSPAQGTKAIESRPRPPFAVARWTWTDAQARRFEADELSLRRLVRHPRVAELG